MSLIDDLLRQIETATYGRDVRSAIHDSIEQCYDDVTTARTNAEAATSAANTAATNANTKATAANTAATNATNAASSATSAASAATSAASSANTAAGRVETAVTNANNALSIANTARDTANAAASAATTAASNANTARDAANTAASNATTAVTNANAARDAANTAATNAANAAVSANTAATNANTARDAANAAASTASTAATNANTARDAANTAASTASTAATNANTARDSANTAATNATTAATNANTARESANEAAASANAAVTRVGEALDNVASALSQSETAIYNAGQAADRANRAASDAGDAALMIDNMTVTSENVAASESADAVVTDVDGHKNIHFKLRQGEQGASFAIKGDAYETLSDLESAITDPAIGDIYNVGTSAPFTMYRWTGTTWENEGAIGISVSALTNSEVATLYSNGSIAEPTTKYLNGNGVKYLAVEKIQADISNKVDKDGDKVLSTNDFTNSYKNKVDSHESSIITLNSTKVNKDGDKVLSTNDFTNSYKTKLDEALSADFSTLTALGQQTSGTDLLAIRSGNYTYKVPMSQVAPQPLVLTIPAGQWNGSGPYTYTVNVSNVTADTVTAITYSKESQDYITTGFYVVPAAGSITIGTTVLPTGTVTLMVQFVGVLGAANVQVLADVYSTSQALAKADVVDGLTSTATNVPLSAKQGKVLKDAVDALGVQPYAATITTGQWSGSGSDYYVTVSASNVTMDSILIPHLNSESIPYLRGHVWCVPASGSFTIHTSVLPTDTVTILVQFVGVMGEAQYQVLSDVYSTSQTYSKAEADAAIAQSTAALDGLKFLRVYLEANTPKTITVSNTARCMLFFVSGYNTCCGDAALAHYGTGHSDGRVWFHEATNITIDTSTDGCIVFTATQNTFCSIMALSGTYTEV